MQQCSELVEQYHVNCVALTSTV